MSGRTIFQNASVLTGDRQISTGSVVVRGRHIESVGADPVEPRPGDRTLDLRGKTVMPGLVLCHYHAAYWNLGATRAPVGLEVPPSLQAMRAVDNMRRTLQSGVTSAISAGAAHAIDACLKMGMAEGSLTGPRLVAGSHDLSTTGHSADLTFPWYWDLHARGGVRLCDGPDEFRRGVREEVKAGAEIIKLFVTGGHGVGTPGRNEMTMDEMRAAIETAHDRGVMIRGHIASRETVLAALGMGMDIIDHGDGFDEACIEKMLGTAQSLAPSLMFPKAMMAGLPAGAYLDETRREFDAMARILPAANKAGVRLLLGDDYGSVSLPHGQYASELQLYVDIGIPAIDVIRWGTKYGAEAMGRAGELGTLEAGKLADLLVVDGDPLADIKLCATPDSLLAIVQDGVFHKDQLDGVRAEKGARAFALAG